MTTKAVRLLLVAMVIFLLAILAAALAPAPGALWYLAQSIRIGLIAWLVWEARDFWKTPKGRARVLGVIIAGTLFASCGGGATTAPTPSAGLAGTWRGSVSMTKPVPVSLPMTVTLTPLALTGGTTYEAVATWGGITTRAMTATAIGSQFSLSGSYPSPLGCDGFAGGTGNVDPGKIDASWGGSSSCDSVFEGHMVLTR